MRLLTNPTVLAPYRGVRYHLKEQRLAGQTPENAKELFNLRHSSLRNVIERIFGVVKRKFKILDIAAEYSIQTQIHIALAVLGLANFITKYEGILKEELDAADAEIEDDETEEELPARGTTVESSDMALKRDQMAKIMWEDYCSYIRA